MIDWHTVMKTDYPEACRAIARILPAGLKSSQDGEDFVQLAICELLRQPVDYRGPKTLIMIAKCRMIDAIRAQYRKGKPLELEDEPIDTRASHQDQAEAAELLERLASEGGAEAREMIRLRADGWTNPEIAERSGTGLRSVQRFFRGLAGLRPRAQRQWPRRTARH
jgi:DNA-directed RNA polymerase specialized sigma24 family protein